MVMMMMMMMMMICDLLKGLSHLQLGDQKVTLNQLDNIFWGGIYLEDPIMIPVFNRLAISKQDRDTPEN